MTPETKEKVDSVLAYAKRNKKGGYSVYGLCKRELEILDLTSKEYDQIIIKICRELSI